MRPANRRKLLLEFFGAYLMAAGIYLFTGYREKGVITASDLRALALSLVGAVVVVASVAAMFRLLAPPKKGPREAARE